MFLDNDYYQANARFILNPGTIDGQTEDFNPDQRFCTRFSNGPEITTRDYGIAQDDYSHQISEVALVMSEILCQTHKKLDDLGEAFKAYLEGCNDSRPWGAVDLSLFNLETMPQCLWVFTRFPVERFFSCLALHRHVMAEPGCKTKNTPNPYGMNRYQDVYELGEVAKTGNTLITDLSQEPYLTVLNRFRQTPHYLKFLDMVPTEESHRNEDVSDDTSETIDESEFTKLGSIRQPWPVPGTMETSQQVIDISRKYELVREFNDEIIEDAGYLDVKSGLLVNTHVSKDDYRMIYNHLDGLFINLITQNLSLTDYLRDVFTIQYWFVHIMPWRRGTAAIMNMFLYAMIAYYNRTQAPQTGRPLPLVPNRMGYIPDLEALLCCASLEDFITASMNGTIYCVDFRAYA